jgi:hypothetical protein
MSAVREMRGRYMVRIENIGEKEGCNGDIKKVVQKWKTEKKNIYGTKVVSKMFRQIILVVCQFSNTIYSLCNYSTSLIN